MGQARKKAQVETAGETYYYGCRSTSPVIVAKVRELAQQSLSRRQIAVATGVSVGTVQHYLTAA